MLTDDKYQEKKEQENSSVLEIALMRQYNGSKTS